MAKQERELTTSKRKARRERSSRSKAPKRKPQSDELRGTGALVPDNRECAVVAIGASAGGLEAFKHFLIATPDNTGIAFVLIQHLDPTHESLTAELLGKHTRMSVVQVVDEMVIEPNHVYVMPPNKFLTISGRKLQLTQPVQRRGVRVPIDFFFRSLADDQQERAIGIVLSGTGSDGTLGAREIKAAGGMVMVQAPDSASFDGMPRSAIAAGVADYVLPVEKMPEMLIAHVQKRYVQGPVARPVVQRAPDELTTIIGLLRARFKYDFSCYKKGTLTRRIQRRMGLKHVSDMAEYVAMLRHDTDEVTALYKDVLIGVTSFFRNPEAWKALEKLAIDPLIHQHNTQSPLRVWVAGCATGDEAYSLAMVLTERLQRAGKNCSLTIFASDIDQDALAFARAAVYPASIAADITPDRLHRFFTKGEHTWRINKEIREAVVFAEQNVVSDPPFSKLDFVSCRNLLIYLEPEVQKRILAMFHFALRDGGHLFLGNAETNAQQPDLFEPVSRKWRIYRRIRVPRRLFVMPAPASRQAPDIELPPPVIARRTRLPAAAQQAVFQRFVPACAVVNRQLEVCYLYGPIDDYLQLPGGEQNHNLIAMARQGLRTSLRVAIQQAIDNDKPVSLDDVRVRRGQQFDHVRVTIEPLRHPEALADLLLVSFDAANAEQRVRLIYVEPAGGEPLDKPESVAEYQTVIRQLERDLTETRDHLQTSIEQFETSNEEFKAAHEEVTSINEELQSTNEELETSKEELQSLNEELQTVNSQLETRVNELEATNNDLHNLLASIDHATLFLDRQFRIRRFTSATTNLLRLIESDIGRPFNDFAKNFSDDLLLVEAERVLKQLSPIDKEIRDQQGRCYVRRIVPYRTRDDRIDGVVITFVDITQRKQAEASLNALNESLEQQVAERTNLLQLVHDITAVANQARTVEEALSYAVERIARYNGWHAGHVYMRAEDDTGDLVPTNIWYSAEGVDLTRFKQVTCESRLGLSQPCMVCDVFHNAELQWIEDVQSSGEYLRNQMIDGSDFDVRTAIAFPLFVENRVEAVLEFFSRDLITRDARFVDAMQNVGIQLGHVLQRKESDRQMAQLTLAERQRLGRELHDTLGQQMSAVGMLVAALRDELSEHHSAGSVELLDKLDSLVQQSQNQVRSLMVGLLPVDVEGGGLPASLTRLSIETNQMYGLACRFVCEDEITLADSFTATQLLLIAREAIHNAAKHARAKEILIELAEGQGVRLSVTDDGIGLPADGERASSMGLRIMRHRAALIEAELRVESPPQGGTVVSCLIQQGRMAHGETAQEKSTPQSQSPRPSPSDETNDRDSR